MVDWGTGDYERTARQLAPAAETFTAADAIDPPFADVIVLSSWVPAGPINEAARLVHLVATVRPRA